MEPVVDGAQVTARQVGVDLGGADVGVAEHGLHGAQIGAALDCVRGYVESAASPTGTRRSLRPFPMVIR